MKIENKKQGNNWTACDRYMESISEQKEHQEAMYMIKKRVGKMIITGIVVALSAISGVVAVELSKTVKKRDL